MHHILQTIDKSNPIMIIEATEYVARLLVKRLLTEGITTHAPIRNSNNKEKPNI
jgi:hypothetical protein